MYNVTKLHKIKNEEIPEHDLLIGGFPCQAFSVAGLQKGFEDTRGTLFFEVARIIKYHKPKAFLLENVKNLVSHDKGKTFKVILEILEEKLGYKVYHKVLNSMTHANVPQNRERIFIVGFRKDFGIEENDIHMFLDQDAFKSSIEYNMKSLFYALKENDRLIFYYVGHGFHNGITNYLSTYNTS